MSDAVIIALTGSCTTTFGIIVVAWLNTRQNRVISTKVDDYHKAVNGNMDKLLKVTGESEKAKGVIQGKADEKKNKK